MTGGNWYPQVLGLVPGSGTDKEAGQDALFFVGGQSKSNIRFDRLPPSSPLRKKPQQRSDP
jgi:hypothetical protein